VPEELSDELEAFVGVLVAEPVAVPVPVAVSSGSEAGCDALPSVLVLLAEVDVAELAALACVLLGPCGEISPLVSGAEEVQAAANSKKSRANENSRKRQRIAECIPYHCDESGLFVAPDALL
jgi:hypothetical protein